MSCCAYAARDEGDEGGLGACELEKFGRNQCQESCWTKLELTRVKCTIDNWDTICPTIGSGTTCGGVAEADEDGGSCWALYEFNALLESCVDNESFTRPEKEQLWGGENGQYTALPGGFDPDQINCLTGFGGENVVQTRKQQALPAIIDNALNCPSTQSLVRFLGVLETIRETPSNLIPSKALRNLNQYYGFNVWQRFFPTNGIVDKLAQSMCTNGIENSCSV